MIIQDIQLENFRQFRGKTPRIAFAAGPGPRITVFHGEMGHGKTTLLNAFRWALHGTTGVSDRFQDPWFIVNKDVKDSDPDGARASVVLRFIQQGLVEGDKTVTVTRWVMGRDEPIKDKDEARPLRSAPTKLLVAVAPQNPGEPVYNLQDAAAQDYINAVIPEGILDVLFFDGEGIDKLATANQNKKMAEAVCNLLGFSVVERAIADLKHADVLGSLEAKRNESADIELKEKYVGCRQKEEEVDRLKGQQLELEAVRDRLGQEESELRAELAKSSDVKDIEARRAVLENQLKADRLALRKAEQDLAGFIAKRGFALVSPRLIKAGLMLESRLRDEHKFPAPMMSEFVRELLAGKKCICGRRLEAGSEPERCVGQILSVARDRDFHDAATSVGRTLGEMNSNLLSDRKELEKRRDECIRLDHDITRNSAEVRDLSEKLLKLGAPDIKLIEQKLSECLRSSGAAGAEINKLAQVDIPAAQKSLEALRTAIQRLESTRQVNAEIAAKVALVRDAISFLEESLRLAAEEVESRLAEKVNDRFSKLIDISSRAIVRREARKAGFADRFHVDIETLAADGTYRPESGVNTGKRQCLSLAFISSLVEFAAERGALRSTLGSMLPGENYPVVMDAPFSVIDELAASKVAQLLPSYANQVICLLNTSNYSAPIAACLDRPEFTGKRYAIVHHHRKGSRKDRRVLKIKGTEVAVTEVSPDMEYEWASIEDISNI